MKTYKACASVPRLKVVSLLATFLILVGFAAPAVPQTAQENLRDTQTREEEQLRGKAAEALGKGDPAAATSLLSDMMLKMNQPNQKAAVSGSVFFEQITGCGFYPQETRLECIINIKQQGGYGGPIETFGSTEHVYFCVDWNNNGTFESTESVGQGSVVMHDGSARTSYAVYRDINIPGGFRTRSAPGGTATTATSAPIHRAQATLSWLLPPTGCNFSPIWGNVFNFRIRFDPIR